MTWLACPGEGIRPNPVGIGPAVRTKYAGTCSATDGTHDVFDELNHVRVFVVKGHGNATRR
jgi:hypothetical protein